MTEEELFLSKILSNPADNVTRLVYADWLEERGDDESLRKARFLRLDHELAALPDSDGRRKTLSQELKLQVSALPVSWMVVVARVPIENCELGFEFECPMQWSKLQATKNPEVRFCDTCKKAVYYCQTIDKAQRHARAGRCVAIDSRVVRTHRDLEERMTTVGRLVQMPERAEPEPAEPDSLIKRWIRRIRGK
jgi:uncharacterized protein (TIGR02996 family)